jgi:hypothetical protein
MSYIGKSPVVGNFVKLDTITTSATTTFNLLNGGVAYFPQSANNCLVSLNGILQAPTDSYTISGSTIIFSSALTTSDVIDFIIVLGDVLNIGTPSDNTVSLAKLTATGTKNSTTFLRGDNTFASAGKLLQVVSTTKTDVFTASLSNSFTDITGLSVSITPSSASNKILITSMVNFGCSTGYPPTLRLFRDSTHICLGTGSIGNRQFSTTSAGGGQDTSDQNRGMTNTISFLDSPNTTSAVTYKINGGVLQSAGIFSCNTSGADGDFNYMTRSASTITVMEIAG